MISSNQSKWLVKLLLVVCWPLIILTVFAFMLLAWPLIPFAKIHYNHGRLTFNGPLKKMQGG